MTSTPDETPDNPAAGPADPAPTRPATGPWSGPEIDLDLTDDGHEVAMSSRRSCRVIPPGDPDEVADEMLELQVEEPQTREPQERAPQE